jgi:hypothetical protein
MSEEPQKPELTTEDITKLAYHLWEAAGRPPAAEVSPTEFWNRAVETLKTQRTPLPPLNALLAAMTQDGEIDWDKHEVIRLPNGWELKLERPGDALPPIRKFASYTPHDEAQGEFVKDGSYQKPHPGDGLPRVMRFGGFKRQKSCVPQMIEAAKQAADDGVCLPPTPDPNSSEAKFERLKAEMKRDELALAVGRDQVIPKPPITPPAPERTEESPPQWREQVAGWLHNTSPPSEELRAILSQPVTPAKPSPTPPADPREAAREARSKAVARAIEDLVPIDRRREFVQFCNTGVATDGFLDFLESSPDCQKACGIVMDAQGETIREFFTILDEWETANPGKIGAVLHRLEAHKRLDARKATAATPAPQTPRKGVFRRLLERCGICSSS